MNQNDLQVGTLYSVTNAGKLLQGMYAGYCGEKYVFWEIVDPQNMNIIYISEKDLQIIKTGFLSREELVARQKIELEGAAPY